MRKRKKKNRSQIMKAVHSENTAPEMKVRRALFRAGMRYRLHMKDLPGTPDLFVLKYEVAILVNGCFWHQHGCKFTMRPKSNLQFWNDKFDNNLARDVKTLRNFAMQGIRVAVVWECSLKTEEKRTLERLIEFIQDSEEFIEI